MRSGGWACISACVGLDVKHRKSIAYAGSLFVRARREAKAALARHTPPPHDSIQACPHGPTPYAVAWAAGQRQTLLLSVHFTTYFCSSPKLTSPPPFLLSQSRRSKQAPSTAWGSGLLPGRGQQRTAPVCGWVVMCSRRLYWARRGSSPNPTVGGCRLRLLRHARPSSTARKWKGK